MYIENKSAQLRGQSGVRGPTCTGRVTFSKSRKSLYYRGKTFQSLKGSGRKANYFDVETLEQYCILALRKTALMGCTDCAPPIDEDAKNTGLLGNRLATPP